jgi:hypothetical protein
VGQKMALQQLREAGIEAKPAHQHLYSAHRRNGLGKRANPAPGRTHHLWLAIKTV